MAPIFAKFRGRTSPRVSIEAVMDSSPSNQPDLRADMPFAISELPPDNAVRNTSLFDTNDTTEKDEWLGKLYLDQALVFLLLRRTSSSESIVSLKQSLPKEYMAFRYDNLCHQLLKSEVRQYRSSELGCFKGHLNFEKESLGWIGAIRRRGTPQEQQILERAIVDNSGSYGPTSSSESNVANPIPPGVALQEDSSDEDSASSDSEVEIWRYTKKLQELFVGKTVVPVYQDLTLRGYPPKFWAEVTYRGKAFSAKAGNKKLAKHRSSKKLCVHLGIKVTGV